MPVQITTQEMLDAKAGKKPSNYDEVMDEKTRKKANKAYEDASKIGPGRKLKPTPSEELKSSPVAGLDLTKPNPANSYSPSSYAKGGSASSRADGCCVKGKTRGKML
jgi:hypothetical protein